MPQEMLPAADPQVFTKFIHARGAALRDNDTPPQTQAQWDQRRKALRDNMLAAMGAPDGPPSPLEVKEVSVLKREG